MDYRIWGQRELIERIHELERPRLIVVEVSGGVANAIHGLREGDFWELADWDNDNDDENGILITKAKMQK